jgi:hypothetical protein
MNVFFSGSMKTLETFPWWYPANIHRTENGTNVDPSDPKSKIAYGLYYA